MKQYHLSGDSIPTILQSISGPPQELYILGELEPLLERPRLAVIGSRKPTPYGRQVTQDLVGRLAGQGIVIISGLAIGVDSIAHRACLEAGGQTIAVLPSGLDAIYPAAHQPLASRILEQGGVLITEYASDTIAFKSNFVARNRLVSGLADGVLIIEAAEKSGTLHTANFALDQAKVVMVVPGNITSPLSAGTNNLIKVGAIPITSAQDVLLAIGLEDGSGIHRHAVASNDAEAALLTLLGQGVTDSAQLLALGSLEPALFNQTLTMLEITGKIRPLGAGHWGLN